jgi:hypothetical protein
MTEGSPMRATVLSAIPSKYPHCIDWVGILLVGLSAVLLSLPKFILPWTGKRMFWCSAVGLGHTTLLANRQVPKPFSIRQRVGHLVARPSIAYGEVEWVSCLLGQAVYSLEAKWNRQSETIARGKVKRQDRFSRQFLQKSRGVAAKKHRA